MKAYKKTIKIELIDQEKIYSRNKEKTRVIINAITVITKALEGTKTKISETEKELTYMQNAS